ncbi:MAG TPA: S4 domain-containing protein, partial [Candidatus Eremiobacteraeota bacterium]|nr:S4 domain-containing protein [Candidatus Eremiobacteraeota bacterium]
GKIWIVKLLYLSSLVETRLEARRLISQGEVTVDRERMLDVNAEVVIKDGTILKVGKFSFCKIKIISSQI